MTYLTVEDADGVRVYYLMAMIRATPPKQTSIPSLEQHQDHYWFVWHKSLIGWVIGYLPVVKTLHRNFLFTSL